MTVLAAHSSSTLVLRPGWEEVEAARPQLAVTARRYLAQVRLSAYFVTIPRSETNQEGMEPEFVVVPIEPNPVRCPVRALHTWTELASISSRPVFRPVSTGNKAVDRSLNAYTVNYLVQAAIKRAGIDPLPYPPARLCHLCPPAGVERPGHSPPDPAPLHGCARAVGERARGPAGQSEDAIGTMTSPNRTRPAPPPTSINEDDEPNRGCHGEEATTVRLLLAPFW